MSRLMRLSVVTGCLLRRSIGQSLPRQRAPAVVVSSIQGIAAPLSSTLRHGLHTSSVWCNEDEDDMEGVSEAYAWRKRKQREVQVSRF